LRQAEDENEGGEKPIDGDGKDVEGQWKEDVADDSTTGGECKEEERLMAKNTG